MKHSVKDWMMAVRPWSFPASSMPVVVTLAYLYWMGQEVNWTNGVWALLNIIVFHAAGNCWSDYFDYRRRVDDKDTFGSKVLTDKMFTPREVICLSWVLLAVALVAGVGLLMRTGMPLLYMGVGGTACLLLYPPLKYRAWGDAVIFVSYAVLPVMGTCYAATGMFLWEVLWIVLPIGLITVAILHANNTRDIRTDTRAGIQTLAMKLGGRASVYLYCAEILFPFGWIVGLVVAGTLPVWTLLVVVALLPAVGNVRMAAQLSGKGEKSIATLDEMTAKLQLAFSLLFTLSLVLAVLL